MAADDRLTKSVTLIKDLRPGMKNVTCVFIVIDKGQYRSFSKSKSASQASLESGVRVTYR